MLKKSILNSILLLSALEVIAQANFQLPVNIVNNDTAGSVISVTCNNEEAALLPPSNTLNCVFDSTKVSTITNISNNHLKLLCTYDYGFSSTVIAPGEIAQCPSSTKYINVWDLNFQAINVTNSSVDVNCPAQPITANDNNKFVTCSSHLPYSPMFTNRSDKDLYLACLASSPLIQHLKPNDITSCGSGSVAGIVFTNPLDLFKEMTELKLPVNDHFKFKVLKNIK